MLSVPQREGEEREKDWGAALTSSDLVWVVSEAPEMDQGLCYLQYHQHHLLQWVVGGSGCLAGATSVGC